jgi:WD40 repeat protein/DNA polymerase III delta prime subunit
MSSSLYKLIRQCTVKINSPNTNKWGTGFFVARDKVITCAHVVQGHEKEAIPLIRNGRIWTTAIVDSIYFPPIDLALLQVELPEGECPPPCVILDDKVSPFDRLYVYGYPDDFPDGGSVTINCEGDVEDKGVTLIKAQAGQVRPGHSGSPALNNETGGVCGIVSETRGRSTDWGGLLIPISTVFSQFKELRLQNRKACEQDKRWHELTSAPSIPSKGARENHWNKLHSPVFYYSNSQPLLPEVFSGRDEEFQSIKESLIGEESYSVLSIVGPGGIGKTTLAASLFADAEVRQTFEKIIYFSLLNEILPLEFLRTALREVSSQEELDSDDDFNMSLTKLMHFLRKSKNLIILDNYQALFEPDSIPGKHATDFTDYDVFLRRIIEEKHLSTLVILSRENPQRLRNPRNLERRFRSFLIKGISSAAARKLVEKQDELEELKNFTEYEWNEFVTFLQGNPLLILLASKYVQNQYQGQLSEYLARKETSTVREISDFLDLIFDNLTANEREVFLWLAINRKPMKASLLVKDALFVEPEKVMDALSNLEERFLIEKRSHEYFLLPAILEHITVYFTDAVFNEINNKEIHLLNNFCLIKAETEEYLRESQKRYIVDRITSKILINCSRSKNACIETIRSLFASYRRTLADSDGYFTANIIDLLLGLKVDINGWDFSKTSIRQAYLRGVELKQVNFSGCHFHDTVFFETFDSLLDVAINNAGSLVAAGDSNGDVHVWSIADGQPFRRLSNHGNYVRTITFNHQGNILASAGSDSRISVWDISTGKLLRTIKDDYNRVWSIAFTSDDRYLVSGGSDRSIKVWDVKSGEQISCVNNAHDSEVYSVSYNHNKNLIISASMDRKVKVWNADLSECILTITAHNSSVWNAKISPDGNLISSADESGNIVVSEINTGHVLTSFNHEGARIRALEFSPNSQLLASGSDNGTVRLWDVRKSQLQKVMTTGSKAWLWSIAFSPDGSKIIGACEDRSLHIWQVDSGRLLRTLRGYTNVPVRLAFSPDCTLLASGHQDSNVYLWNYKEGTVAGVLDGKNSHSSTVISIDFDSHEGNLLVSGSKDCTVKVWDISDLKRVKCLQTLVGHTNQVWAVGVSPNSELVASGSNDLTVRLWNIKTGECLHTLLGHSTWIWSLAFNPAGNIIATGSDDGTVILWDVSRGKLLRKLEGQTGQAWVLSFSDNSRYLTSCSGKGSEVICTWDVESGRLVRSLAEPNVQLEKIWTAGFSPDKSRLVNTSSTNNLIYVWDIESRKCQKTFGEENGHSKQPWTVVMSYPDGRLVASSSFDQSIKIWDVSSGQCLHTLKVPGPYEGMIITDVKVSNDAEIEILKILGATD